MGRIYSGLGRDEMSLSFGLFLVEQGVLTCDQFCGLVKIQQMAVPSPASVAIRSNLLTVRQVGQVLGLIELDPGRGFVDAARSLGFLGADGQSRLEHEQQRLLPSLGCLLIECGVLTGQQVETLQRAFEKTRMADNAAGRPAGSEQTSALVQAPQQKVPAIDRPGIGQAGGQAATRGNQGHRVHAAQAIRQPKFIQHPQVSQYEEAYYG